MISPSWNYNGHSIDSIGGVDSHPIKVATSENSLKLYNLIETDMNSGIFTGEVSLTGFAPDANDDDMLIQCLEQLATALLGDF